MKKLTREAYNDIKGSLMLSSVAEQIKFTKGKFTVHELRLIDKSKSYEEYRKAVDEVNFKEETKKANSMMFAYLSPDQIKDIVGKLDSVKALFLKL